MQDELDSDTFEATLRFVEECAIETFGEISELTPSVTTLLSPSSELLPFDVASLVDESDQLPTETLATIPLPIPDATVTTDSRTTTRKRKSSRPRKPQANPNRARDEMKFELAYLREKSVQLEQELSHLQQQAQTNATSVVCRENVPTVVIVHHGESTQGLGVWEGIAGRQRKRREDAERENARLRLLLERQRKAAADLANLLRKRVVECARGKDPRAAEHQLSRVLDFHGDIDAFRDLFGHLESTYAEIMPFGLRDTAEAAWDHFKGVEKHFGNGGIYEKAAKNLDQPYTIVEDFTKELHSNYARADMKAKQIVRRYVEADRDMIEMENYIKHLNHGSRGQLLSPPPSNAAHRSSNPLIDDEYRARLHSEEMNRRLREILANQVQLADSLKSILNDQRTFQEIKFVNSLPPALRTEFVTIGNESAIHNELQRKASVL
ncbi:M96 mating-specific protein family [Phytophthora cinnamomi]|uniref:M96 mating-specific protein family n=1 Tax=Phytophthora cinnamomi TaxID=4785 RepID=UPI00355A5726|nr:M96 mating-specific protein family [Phytophthora cinnamomi]